MTAEPAPLPPDAGGAGRAAAHPARPPPAAGRRGRAAARRPGPGAAARSGRWGYVGGRRADPAGTGSRPDRDRAAAATDAGPAREPQSDRDGGVTSGDVGPTPPAPESRPDRDRVAAAADADPAREPRTEGDGAAGSEAGEPVLPEVVRARVLTVAATALGRLPADQVPAPLRAAARFTPSKRVRLAGPALAAALSTDAIFRLRAAEQVERESPDMAEAARTGVLPGAADPVELAAAAYLLRPAGWPELVERSRAALEERITRTRDRARDAEVDKLRAELADAHTAQREQAQRARAAAEAARAEADTLRRQLREQTGARRAAERARAAAEEALAEERRRVAAEDSRSQAELRRLRQRLAEADDAVEAGRRAARETRQADEARLWLLLDTLTGAAQGLRRELALTPTDDRPADSVAASRAAPGRQGRPRRRPRTGRPAARPAPGAPRRGRLQRHQVRVRRAAAGARSGPG